MTTFRAHKGPGGQSACIAFSHDGRRMASCAGGEVKLWDPATCTEIANLYGHQPAGYMPCMAWGITGRYFATASIDHTIRIWDAEAQTLKQVLRGLQATPNKYTFTFSSDDTRFTAQAAQTRKVWHVDSGRELLSFESPVYYSFYRQFRSRNPASEFGLTEPIRNFTALHRAEKLTYSRNDPAAFRQESLDSLATELLSDSVGSDIAAQRALRISSELISLDPSSSRHLFVHSLALYRNRDYEQAATTLQQATELGLHGPAAAFLRAVILKRLGQDDAARTAFTEGNAALSQGESVASEHDALVREVADAFLKPGDANRAIK